MDFIDGLIHESDIEVIWTMASSSGPKPSNKRVSGIEIEDAASDKFVDTQETVNPNEAAHTMAYGDNETWRDDMVQYLTHVVKTNGKAN
jgi:hypothetical protein